MNKVSIDSMQLCIIGNNNDVKSNKNILNFNCWIIIKVNDRFPYTYEDSMTTVLRLETMAYNRLLNVVQKDLCRLEAALQGHIVMSVEVEAAFEEVQKGKLPSTWETYSYPTESMLNDYLEVTKESSRLAKKISTKHIIRSM